jgi:hypothetical protein
MGRRRGETDALLPVKEPRWRVVRDRFSRVIESQVLGPQTDLRAVMQAEADRRRCERWAVEEVPRNCAFFFCDRQNDRVCISIECYEPGPVGWTKRPHSCVHAGACRYTS